MNNKVKDLVSKMTLDEKISMCSGEDFWHLEAVERLGIPNVMVTDGPHGLRKQGGVSDHLGIHESVEAVCYPSAVGTAASFNRDLLKEMGEYLGTECQAEDVSVLLGPAINIKRSPLCGRNFEYMSEDPYLTGELAAEYIKGVQSKNVGTSIKHYAVNNQENNRMTVSAELDERTLREIYLPGFEIPVKTANPWTIMSAYNKINGVYAAENKKLLNDILRDEWGFEGYVVTDWGGINDRVEGLKAGQDLEMPGNQGQNDELIKSAIESGDLDEATLDKAVERILNISFRYIDNRKEDTVFDRAKHHEKAYEIALESMVLLKNEEDILPLDKKSEVAFIGEFAETPRYQGGGSSHINPHKVVSAMDAAKDLPVKYAKGFGTEEDKIENELVKEAVELAKNSEVAVIFAGLPENFESEGYDREHLDIPKCQNHLIEEVLKVQSNVVVVLQNGSPVSMPWVNDVKAILESYLGGETIGRAQVSLLYGDENPSGKLAETFPLDLKDTPAYLNFPGERTVFHGEGVYVGYRYYDTRDIDVLFPFGHGLSYTEFEYSDLKVNKVELDDEDELEVSVNIKNIGDGKGKESIQLYVQPINDSDRPIQELKNFAKVDLEPGETKTVTMKLDKRSFAYYDELVGDWVVKKGDYDIAIGKSSRDIPIKVRVKHNGTKIDRVIDQNTTLGELFANPKTKAILDKLMAENNPLGDVDMSEQDIISEEMLQAMVASMPLRNLKNMVGMMNNEELEGFIHMLNENR